MKAFIPICLYSNGFFLVKENVRKLLREYCTYEEILFVIVDKLYGNNLLIKDKVSTKEEAQKAYEKRGTDIFHLIQSCVREYVNSNNPTTNYVIKRWNEIAEANEYASLRIKVISEFNTNVRLKDYSRKFIDDSLARITERITEEKVVLEEDYLYSEIAMSIYLTEFCGYTEEIWEKPQKRSLPDPIAILYREEKDSLRNILNGKESKRHQLYVSIKNDNYWNLSRGIQDIVTILHELDIKMEKDTYPFYNRTKYIYRGIHRYYDDSEIIEGDSSRKKHILSDVIAGYIRSSLAVRLLKTSSNNSEVGYIRANYINVLQDMIRDVKRHYPEEYPESMSDLDILADIQHNGGATCLVDFSKNFLTALWFACCEDSDSDGYIYCYDIMGDMIKNNGLTYVKKIEEKKDINTLLSLTYKHTNITSDIESRFLLWEPFTRNSRILRQDSIFVFGMEKFKVDDHCIKVLVIKGEEKKHILYALRVLFNITSKTIYNDSVGYATSNKKLQTIDKLGVDSYERGYHNMIKGNFDNAADLLKLWEGEKYDKLELAQKVELHFSLAVCFKNLYRDNQVHYFENAVIEYKNCIRVIKKLLKKETRNPDFERDYYCKKATRSYNSIIDILYEAGKYEIAIKVCDEIIKEVETGFLEMYQIALKDGDKRKLNTNICKLTKIELFVLNTILTYRGSLTEDSENTMRAKYNFFERNLNISTLTQFEQFLVDFYRYVFEVILSKEGEPKDYINKMLNWRFKIERKEIEYKEYNFWNFNDLKKCIDSIDENEIMDAAISKKKYNLQNITAHAISFRDIYEMQSVGRSTEI